MTMPESRQRRSGGFTLMELLTAIAIIGILIAVAIPTFSNDTADTAKAAADEETIRAGYENVVNYVLENGYPESNVYFTLQSDGTLYMGSETDLGPDPWATSVDQDHVIYIAGEAVDGTLHPDGNLYETGLVEAHHAIMYSANEGVVSIHAWDEVDY